MLLWIALLTSIPLLTLYLLERSRYFRLRQYANFPQLPRSLISGHMKALDAVMGEGDRRRHIDQVFLEIKDKLDNPPLFIVDLRPVLYTICVICSHEVAEQISRASRTFPYSLPKGDVLENFTPLIGERSILSAQGSEWKALRKQFNPGFAPQRLISLLPEILDRVQRFVDILDEHAVSGEVVALDELCINLTFDIIGTVTMEEDLRAQGGTGSQSEIVTVFRELVSLYRTNGSASWDQFKLGTKIRRWRLSKKLDSILHKCVRAKYREWKSANSDEGPKNQGKSRSVLALSFEGEGEGDGAATGKLSLSSEFLSRTCDQLKTFLFAGHDTTSSLLQWTFYELSRTPHALKMARRELEEILGPDANPAVVYDLLRRSSGTESLVSRMVYLAAIIKEALRLHPPAGTGRFVPHGTGFSVALPDGQSLCLDGMLLHNCETIIQRDERVYGATKDVFMPERWLDSNNKNNKLEPTSTGGSSRGSDGTIGGIAIATATGIPPSAWRPFERGPRNCIGQELANLEAKVVLACTLRRFDFVKVGLGEVALDSAGKPVMGAFGQHEVKEELFNIMEVTGKPVDGTRVRVSFA
ncbi:cytochrome P450 [Aspergillus pseudoustus]|uniref:Cytochrome P450 n=1 Tax=Aspergillus pseudoustus TaxID=1810923 RepID=A0ABR4K2W9_9EURO